ncbi:glyoxalase [Streptomyces sp. NPDC091272]|uniref:glyoxalase n=1 Tax=Streptomyces sp. NPDC091272 TaxID=3365981 RepID=UPI003825032C
MTTSTRTASLTTVALEVPDVAAADRFCTAFGVSSLVSLRPLGESAAGSSGFRGFTLALTVAGPATVNRFLDAAVQAGATVLKPGSKSLWGYGGVVQAPDGAIWKVATSAKKDTGPATSEIDDFVVLLGVDDVKASKQYYADRGLQVARSFGGKYAEFAVHGSSRAKLALYKRTGLAKDLGTSPEGSGSHRLVLGGTLGDFTDPDGFTWTSAPAQ